MRFFRALVVGLMLCACIPSWDAPIDPNDPAEIVFEVPKGSNPTNIAVPLVEAGLVPSELQWKVYRKASGNDATCMKAGKHKLSKSMSLNEVVAELCKAPLADDVPFTQIEGWRIIDIDAALAEKGLIKAGDYIQVATTKDVTLPFPITAKTLEGYLYPETYMVPAGGVDVKKLIVRQLETFQERWLSKHPDLGKRSLEDIVIVASMLEREEPRPSNRPLVAGIMWKRVDTNNGLGIDATSRYTCPNWNDDKCFLPHLRDPEDPYNSRLRKGLPPTAIGNPTVESLDAALNPEITDFWYYLHDAQGNIHPAKNAAEHDANREKFNVH